ncbi:hypothetical protein FF38_03425 [Lucilia cuprina]|uniref:ATP-dependent DNA helicase n=1 Tax=Lucilia cuprina TaxID=7375 RepID=A0A0L0BVC2_LUCCU|nr:hypothetical protein FF38_03425 [Lucilia cuprina]
MADIIAICKSYYGKTGIVYCLSKKSCETTAAQLKKAGINAQFYHAGMEVDTRTKVQTDWQQGRCSVVCATIAFGMGIDKPDVRYVVHSTLPRNMEGYYQETGRAGRDGKLSKCIMFYNFRDFMHLKKMISDDKSLKPGQREHHSSLLHNVMQYCENETDCRRKQVLLYFNEQFDSKKCNRKCDNCMNAKNMITKDCTAEARQNLLQTAASPTVEYSVRNSAEQQLKQAAIEHFGPFMEMLSNIVSVEGNAQPEVRMLATLALKNELTAKNDGDRNLKFARWESPVITDEQKTKVKTVALNALTDQISGVASSAAQLVAAIATIELPLVGNVEHERGLLNLAQTNGKEKGSTLNISQSESLTDKVSVALQVVL